MEPTPEAIEIAEAMMRMQGQYEHPKTRRDRCARALDAFADRRVAEKDAEIASLKDAAESWKRSALEFSAEINVRDGVAV